MQLMKEVESDILTPYSRFGGGVKKQFFSKT